MDARTAITHVHSNLLVVWWLLYENSVSRNTRISLNTRSRRTQIHGYLNFWQWRKGSKRGSREREKIGGRGIGERRKGGLFHFVDVSLKVRRRSDGSSAIWACPRIASKLERGWTTLSISAQVSLPSSVISVPRNPWVSFRQRSFGRVISCTSATTPNLRPRGYRAKGIFPRRETRLAAVPPFSYRLVIPVRSTFVIKRNLRDFTGARMPVISLRELQTPWNDNRCHVGNNFNAGLSMSSRRDLFHLNNGWRSSFFRRGGFLTRGRCDRLRLIV